MSLVPLVSGRSAGPALVVQSSLLILVGLVPAVFSRRDVARGARVSLVLSLLLYGINFGLRTLYFLVAPDVVLYPAFAAAEDVGEHYEHKCGAEQECRA